MYLEGDFPEALQTAQVRGPMKNHTLSLENKPRMDERAILETAQAEKA